MNGVLKARGGEALPVDGNDQVTFPEASLGSWRAVVDCFDHGTAAHIAEGETKRVALSPPCHDHFKARGCCKGLSPLCFFGAEQPQLWSTYSYIFDRRV